MDNKDIKTTNSRRKFLVRAGMGSLPVLMALKSKGAWGFSTQNCNLSASMSKMQSVQAEQFETCTASFHSHGAAKSYFKLEKGATTKRSDGRNGFFNSSSGTYHQGDGYHGVYDGVVINENTLFNAIFGAGFGGTIADAVDRGPTNLIRNIAALFLHAMFYRGQSLYPEPEAFVRAYSDAMLTGNSDQLAQVLEMYIDGAE
jgi:hypothetical protein